MRQSYAWHGKLLVGSVNRKKYDEIGIGAVDLIGRLTCTDCRMQRGPALQAVTKPHDISTASLIL